MKVRTYTITDKSKRRRESQPKLWFSENTVEK